MVKVNRGLLSVILCTRNRRALLEGALASFKSLRIPPGWRVELVVVDNGSTDGTSAAVASAAKDFPFPVRGVVEPTPGLGRAHAAGLRAAQGELIACTDDDCLVMPDWCEAIVNAFAAQPTLAGLFGRVLPVDDGSNPEWRVAIKTSDLRATFQFPCWPMIGFGNNMAFRRAALEIVGGFNPLFGPGGMLWSAEELELVYRVLRHGGLLGYEPSASVWHRGRTSQAAWASTNVRDAKGFGAFAGAYAIRGDLFALKLFVWEWQGMLTAWWQGVRRRDRKRRQVSGWYARWLPLGFLAGCWLGLRRDCAPRGSAFVISASSDTVPDVSVVVSTRNRAHLLGELLQSLVEDQDAGGIAYEVVIVDNGSQDHTRAVVEAAQQRSRVPLTYVCEPAPGVSRGRNAGAWAARGDYLAFTDDDCLAGQEWVHSVAESFRSDAEVAGVFGRVLPLSGSVDEKVVSVKIQAKATRYRFPCRLFIGHGNNMAFRRRVFLDQGGFDVTLGVGTPLYAAEDLDLVYRLLRQGSVLAYDPRGVIFHRPRNTVRAARTAECRYGVGFGACLARYVLRGDLYAVKYLYWHLLGMGTSFIQAVSRRRWADACRCACFTVGAWWGILKRCGLLLMGSRPLDQAQVHS